MRFCLPMVFKLIKLRKSRGIHMSVHKEKNSVSKPFSKVLSLHSSDRPHQLVHYLMIKRTTNLTIKHHKYWNVHDIQLNWYTNLLVLVGALNLKRDRDPHRVVQVIFLLACCERLVSCNESFFSSKRELWLQSCERVSRRKQ